MSEVSQPSSPPNWETFKLDIFCPRCDYNLRALTGSRCPECGLVLDWPRIIAGAEKRLESPLFEYRWRERPVRSFFHTIRLCFYPKRLWSWLPITDKPNLPGLFVLFVLSCLLYVLIFEIAFFFADVLRLFASGRPLSSMSRWIISYLKWTAIESSTVCVAHILTAFLAWTLLHVFQQSITKHRIKRNQLWRLVILVYVPVILIKCLAVFSVFGTYSVAPWTRRTMIVSQITVDGLAVGFFVISLGLGLTRYLQVRRGWAVTTCIFVLMLLSATTTDVVVSAAIGSWDNVLNQTLYSAWPGLWLVVGRLLGLN